MFPMSIWKYANPGLFIKIVNKTELPLATVTLILLSIGLIWGFFFTPNDYVQKGAVKIIYVHVPSALMAINCWLMMLVASMIWLIRRHRTSILLAKAAGPVGLAMALIAIITGALWGEPIWGTYWAWEPRLTSFFILSLHYIIYILLWNIMAWRDSAADISAILCLVGSVFALLSRYAVNFWQQGLHQGASLSLDRDTNIHNVFYIPLLLCMGGFMLLCILLILIRTRTEIYRHQVRYQRPELAIE